MPGAVEPRDMTRILVPIDGSEQSDAALEYALDEFQSDDITVINIIDPIEAGYTAQATVPGYSEEWYEQSEEEAQALFEDARDAADEYGVTLDTVTEVGRPSRTIVDYAEENDYDHIVMGSHGRSGVTRVLLGSVAESVVRRSNVPVTIVR
ncbi:universal stress protein UspA [Halarchaeum nitratireducens]|uniref:Universal stress protein UspA n=2 Tax=Halarchaeum nitratireducens TaxID=489913 RepID=A0A830G7K3_9EURY|nr:universal stress protein UspA [Halarchaeum nitratireducens]